MRYNKKRYIAEIVNAWNGRVILTDHVLTTPKTGDSESCELFLRQFKHELHAKLKPLDKPVTGDDHIVKQSLQYRDLVFDTSMPDLSMLQMLKFTARCVHAKTKHWHRPVFVGITSRNHSLYITYSPECVSERPPQECHRTKASFQHTLRESTCADAYAKYPSLLKTPRMFNWYLDYLYISIARYMDDDFEFDWEIQSTKNKKWDVRVDAPDKLMESIAIVDTLEEAVSTLRKHLSENLSDATHLQAGNAMKLITKTADWLWEHSWSRVCGDGVTRRQWEYTSITAHAYRYRLESCNKSTTIHHVEVHSILLDSLFLEHMMGYYVESRSNAFRGLPTPTKYIIGKYAKGEPKPMWGCRQTNILLEIN